MSQHLSVEGESSVQKYLRGIEEREAKDEAASELARIVLARDEELAPKEDALFAVLIGRVEWEQMVVAARKVLGE